MEHDLRLKLDKRIHCQRKALRDNWEIVEQRQRGMRRFTMQAIRDLNQLCDLAGIEKHSPSGGTWSLKWRTDRLAEFIAAVRNTPPT